MKNAWLANTQALDGSLDPSIYCTKAMVAGLAVNYLILRVKSLRHAIWPLGLGLLALLKSEKFLGERRLMNRVGSVGCQSLVVGVTAFLGIHMILRRSVLGVASGSACCFFGFKQWKKDADNKKNDVPNPWG